MDSRDFMLTYLYFVFNNPVFKWELVMSWPRQVIPRTQDVLKK